MKKGFSLIEIIFVLIILSITTFIVANIMINTSKRYIKDSTYRNLQIESNIYSNKLKVLFKNVVTNTIIGDKCNINNNDCFNGNISDFKSLIDITKNSQNSEYPVIEFMNENTYFYNIWNDDKYRNVLLSSKFVDLIETKTLNTDDNHYIIKVPYSNFNNIFYILNEYNQDFGNNEEQKLNKNTVILMSGEKNEGDILDIKNSYGWNNTKSLKLFEILNIQHNLNTNIYNSSDYLEIKPIDNLNGIKTEPYQTFFIINSATALIPKKNSNGLYDYYISILYKPWKKQTYKDGKYYLFMKNVSNFILKQINNKLYVSFCIVDPTIELKNGQKIKVCKELFLN